MNIKNSTFIIPLSLLFVGMCLLHFLSQRPIWLDEDFVLQNIKSLSYGELFGRLKPVQSFPRVHLVLVKAFSENFGFHVFSLRIFSFITMLAAFLMWVRHYKVAFNEKWLIFLGLLSFVCSYRFSYYAAELKPYAMDVFVVALYFLYFQYQNTFGDKKPTRMLYTGAILLPLSIFFSYASIFVVWIVGYNFLLLLRDNKKLVPLFVFNIVVCGIAGAIFYCTDLKYSITKEGVNYWETYFICTDTFLCFADTFGDGVKKIVTYWWGTSKNHIRAAVGFIPFFFYAMFHYGVRNFKMNRLRIGTIETLSLVLFVELIILGMLKKYPFTGERLTLFFAPFVFYLVLKGISDLALIGKSGKIGRFLKGFFLSYYGAYCLVCFWNTFTIHLSLYSAQ